VFLIGDENSGAGKFSNSICPNAVGALKVGDGSAATVCVGRGKVGDGAEVGVRV